MNISCDCCTSRILTGLEPFFLYKRFMQSSLLPHAFQRALQNASFVHQPAKGDVTAALWQQRQKSAALTQQIFTTGFVEG